MSVLSVATMVFMVFETLNVIALYFWPGSRLANGVGVFDAWEKSQSDQELHQFVRYLVYWVAGTKLGTMLSFLLLWVGIHHHSVERQPR